MCARQRTGRGTFFTLTSELLTSTRVQNGFYKLLHVFLRSDYVYVCLMSGKLILKCNFSHHAAILAHFKNSSY